MFRKLLENIINRKVPDGCSLLFHSVSVKHFNRIKLTEVAIFRKGERIVTLKSFELIISYRLLLRGVKRFYKFRLKGVVFEVFATKGASDDQSKTVKDIRKFSIHKKILNALQLIFLSLPETEITDCTIKYNRYILIANHLEINHESFSGQLTTAGIEANIVACIKRKEKIIVIKDSQITTTGGISTLKGKIQFYGTQELKLKCKLLLENVKIDSPYLCDKSIYVKRLFQTFEIYVGESHVEIVDMSIYFDDLPLSLVARIESSKELLMTIAVTANSNKSTFLNRCFSSIFKSVSSSGTVTLLSSFAIDFKNYARNTIKFEIEGNSLAFSNCGELAKLKYHNGFNHFVKKENLFTRIIDCSHNNPNYVTLNKVPEQLIKFVLFCEDPRFYSHKGVDTFFIRLAIARDINAKTFSAGASTITMQLVKNLFLNGKKNLVRKVEEIVLSLIIENHLKVPKDTLLELYLNIIEFGPNIYGIKEGAYYYFGKEISQLSLTESIVLTYIIKRPVFFNEALIIKSTQLKNNLKNYLRDISTRLLKFKYITEADISNLDKVIQFRSELGLITL
jgi:hypothetical protein